MSRLTHILLYITLIAVSLYSCDIESSDNGDLDGYWQWTSVDTLATGGTEDMRSSKIFWAVQADLLEIRDNTKTHYNVFFRFSHTADSLILSEPVIDNRESNDSILEDYSILLSYGITEIPAAFYVSHLSGSKMVLYSSNYCLSFRKY